ncbi:10719_t:CDS:1, partial [Acaulospora morrowiae]
TRPTTDSGDRQPTTRPRRNDKCFQCGEYGHIARYCDKRSVDNQEHLRRPRSVKHYEIEGDDNYELEEYDKVYNTNVTRKVERPPKRRIEHSDDGEQRARRKPDRVPPTEVEIHEDEPMDLDLEEIPKPRRKREPSVVDSLASYNIADDVLALKSNITLGQLLQYPNQRRNLAKILRRPVQQPQETNYVT